MGGRLPLDDDFDGYMVQAWMIAWATTRHKMRLPIALPRVSFQPGVAYGDLHFPGCPFSPGLLPRVEPARTIAAQVSRSTPGVNQCWHSLAISLPVMAPCTANHCQQSPRTALNSNAFGGCRVTAAPRRLDRGNGSTSGETRYQNLSHFEPEWPA